MSNVVVPTSPTLDGSCGARPGRRGHGAGLGTPSLRRRPSGRARLVDSVPTHPGVLVATYQPSEPATSTSTKV